VAEGDGEEEEVMGDESVGESEATDGGGGGVGGSGGVRSGGVTGGSEGCMLVVGRIVEGAGSGGSSASALCLGWKRGNGQKGEDGLEEKERAADARR
jgi:hypothetical protein